MFKDAVVVFLAGAIPGVILSLFHPGIGIVVTISIVGAFLVYVIGLQHKKD